MRRSFTGIGTAIPAARRGFSLIELIVVLAVIAILAAVAVPVVDLVQSRARGDATEATMEAFGKALDSYFTDHLSYPPALADLETQGYIAGGFGGSAPLRDAWGSDFVYTPGASQAAISSYGPDRTAAAPNLDLVVDGTRILQARTRDDLETIHLGLRNYESRRMTDSLPSLPANWYDAASPAATALGILVQNGYLANSSRYATDAWGTVYIYRGTPSDFVRSANLVEAGKAQPPAGPGPGGGTP